MPNLPFKNYLIFANLVISGICLSIIFASATPIILAQSTDNLDKEIEKAKDQLEDKTSELEKVKNKANEISNSINKLSKDLNVTQAQINTLQSQITELVSDIDNLNKKLSIKKDELDQKNKIKSLVLRNIYIETRKTLLSLLLSGNTFAESAQDAGYHMAYVNSSNDLIGLVNSEIKSFEAAKEEVEKIKAQVETQKKSMLAMAAKIAADAAAAKNSLASISQKQVALQQEKSEIEKKLNELSAQQKSALDAKTETFSTSVGEVPSTGDANSGIGYKPPFSNAFASFSFGAPHRQGMSQYGAKGRAESGQSYQEILKAYYGDVEVKEVDGIPDDIKTDKGSMQFEGKYLNGLAEMPASWHKEALKAQAVAGRTYALARIGWRISNPGAGGTICTTESCQVWSSSKASSGSASSWHSAVESTKHVVLVSKKTGEIFSPLYAASSGGYNNSYSSAGHTTSGGWDTSCKSKDCWTNEAYESKAGSPWFYKGWYKTRSNQTCGRSHPWLTEEEFADIVGAVALYKESSNNQKHLSQIDAKKCWGKDIDDTWSKSEVAEKSGITDISSVSVTYSSSGSTSEVKIKTNKGDLKFSGSDFKAIFNLRAPGAIQIKSALFNIEQK